MNEITEVGQHLPGYEVTAFNFAAESTNKIHDDEVARHYGFRGGLVPGVAMWAYLTRPVFEALGVSFLERGYMRARFVQPIYDGDRVRASAEVVAVEPPTLEIELHDSSGERCAVGEAGLQPQHPDLDLASWPWAPLPAPEDRPPASLESLAPGSVLGSIDVGGLESAAIDALAERYRDEHPAFAVAAGGRALLHPAWVLDTANTLLSSNVLLGPWIHTASEVRYLAVPDWRKPLSLRGHVKEAYERKGHEIVLLDLVLVCPNERIYAHVEHSAIVRPRQ